MMVCMRLHNGVCHQGDRCSFAHGSLELLYNAECSQYLLACELDQDFEESGA